MLLDRTFSSRSLASADEEIVKVICRDVKGISRLFGERGFEPPTPWSRIAVSPL
jgi:hypothetical protein